MADNNPPELPPVNGIDTGVIMEAEVAAPQPAPPVEETQAAKAKRNKKLPLTPHEAIHYFARGIYVDVETGQLRCSCNHKPCGKLMICSVQRLIIIYHVCCRALNHDVSSI